MEIGFSNLFLQCFQNISRLWKGSYFASVQMKYKISKNTNFVQQQREHHHWNVLIESFHLSGHTVRFRGSVQDWV